MSITLELTNHLVRHAGGAKHGTDQEWVKHPGSVESSKSAGPRMGQHQVAQDIEINSKSLIQQ